MTTKGKQTARQTDIPFARPWITEDERQSVMEVLEGHILTDGPRGRDFQRAFAEFMGEGAHCVAVSSCMAALHLAYLEMGVGPGDEVIVPALTHVATAHAVEIVGAKPVFVDCRPGNGNIDVDLVERAMTERTRAISLVHFLGIPCDIEAIMTLANAHGLRVVEDCALAVGARVRSKHVGLFGDAGCFSFYPVKHITTGEGGMFVSRDKAIAERVARLAAFGVDRGHTERRVPGVYDVPGLGLNYRMSEFQAAIGLAQLLRIDEILRRRRANFDRLAARLARVGDIRVLEGVQEHSANSHYCLSFVLEGKARSRRDHVVKELNSAGIGTSVYYPHPVPRLAYYRDRYRVPSSQYPVAIEISDRSIALPVGPHVAEKDVDTIASVVEHVLQAIH